MTRHSKKRTHTHARTRRGRDVGVTVRLFLGTSLVVQSLRFFASKARGKGLISSQETKIHLPQGTVKTLKKEKVKINMFLKNELRHRPYLHLLKNFLLKMDHREFPGGPVVRLCTFTAEGLGLIPASELRSHKPCGTCGSRGRSQI